METPEIKEKLGSSVRHDEEVGTMTRAIDHAAERRLRNKIDLMILPTVCLLYLFCFIDRANIGNARIAGLEHDLGLKGYDFNIVLTMFYISYTVFEIPANILCKYMGPGYFIPLTSVLFGVCSLATAWVHTPGQMMAVRFLLGIFEAGMLPGIAYYLSRWYRRSELTFRLALYIVTAPLAGAFGGLLASAILSLDHAFGVTSWRMIFAIEGFITLILGVISFLTLTDRPASARWLSSEEKDLAETRVRSERVGQTQVLDRMDKKKLIRGITSPATLALTCIHFMGNVTVQGLAFFAPTIVKTLYPNSSVVQQQLYTVPPYIVGAFFTLLLPLISWKIDRRQIFMILVGVLPVCGYIIFLASHNNFVRYAGSFLIASTIFTNGVFPPAQISANLSSDTARSSAIGFCVMMANLGGILSTWAFLPFDAPDFMIGNGINLGTNTAMTVIASYLLIWMKKDNARRDREQEAALAEIESWSQEEIEDLDWKHPEFRWRI